MAEKEKKDTKERISKLGGEKGLAFMITTTQNSLWKKVKIELFNRLRSNPEEIFNKKELSEESKGELSQFLSMEVICETVSYAELLGAYLLAFSKKHPLIQKTLLNYKVKDIYETYSTLKNLSEEEIAVLIGYPEKELIKGATKKFYEEYNKSLNNIKNDLQKIGDFYLRFHDFYNDYKHGFRLFLLNSGDPEKEIKRMIARIPNGTTLDKLNIYPEEEIEKIVKEALKLSTKISQILGILIKIFQERIILDNNTVSLMLFGIENPSKLDIS